MKWLYVLSLCIRCISLPQGVEIIFKGHSYFSQLTFHEKFLSNILNIVISEIFYGLTFKFDFYVVTLQEKKYPTLCSSFMCSFNIFRKCPFEKKVAGLERICTFCAHVDSVVPNRKGGQFFDQSTFTLSTREFNFINNTKPNVSPGYGKYSFIQFKKRSQVLKSAKNILLKSNS